MTVLVASDYAGLWRRTLLLNADGSRDTGTDVTWLQGPTTYVDSRGFAGTLGVGGDVFEWHREIDLEPPGPFPDAGRMVWDGDTLVETGIHENYVEHWVRNDGPSSPCGAWFLRAPDGSPGLLVRAGALFGWAGGGAVVIDTVGGARWQALGIGCFENQVQAKGARWAIDRTEGDIDT